MRVALQPAFLLHRRPYGNTSLLVEMLTADYGRVGLIAQGAAANRQRRALLQPFIPLLLSWSGRGDLYTLTAIEESARGTVLSGTRLYCGFYLNELLYRLLNRHDVDATLFAAYGDSVARLADDPDTEAVLRCFEKRLLQQLGYGLLLDRDSNDEPLQREGQYAYQLERGPVLAGGMETGPILHGASLLALHREDFQDTQVRREAKRLLRHVIAFYLDGRELQTRRYFQARASSS